MKSVPLPQWAMKILIGNKDSITPKAEFKFVPGFAEVVKERVRASEVFQFNLPLMEAGAAMAFYTNSEVRRLCAAAAESSMNMATRVPRFEVTLRGAEDPLDISYSGWPKFMWEGEAWYRLHEQRLAFLGIGGVKRMLEDEDEPLTAAILCAPSVKVRINYDEVPDAKAEVMRFREDAAARRTLLDEWTKRVRQCNTTKQLLYFDPDAYGLLPYAMQKRMNR